MIGEAERTTVRAGGLDAPPTAVDTDGADSRVRLLIVLVWAWIVVPRIVQSVTAPKHRQSVGVDYGGDTHLTGLIKEALFLAVVTTSVWLIVASFRTTRRLRLLPLILMLTPWLYIVGRDLYVDGRPATSAFLYPLVVVALWTSRPSVTTLRTLGHLTVLAAVVSMIMAVAHPPSALFRSDQGTLISEDKQILSSGMLAGFLTQPNNLGQFIALGIPLIGMVPHRRMRMIYFAICAFTIVWTASRSSMYAVGITALAAVVLAAARRPSARRALAGCCVIASFAVVFVVPFVTSDPLAFSQRGGIWHASLPAWHANAWFGQGANWYRELASTSSSIGTYAFHGHNQLVQLLVTGGLCYAIFAGVMLWLASTSSIRLAGEAVVSPALYLIALAGTCVLEVSLVTVDNESMFPMVVIPLTVICGARRIVTSTTRQRGSKVNTPVAFYGASRW